MIITTLNKKILILPFFLMLMFVSFASAGSELDAKKVTVPIVLHLKWFHQFQFAGYYAAVEKGFYQQEGLDVVVRERNPDSNPVAEVLSGRADFGVSDSSLIVARMGGAPVVLMAAIFQHSPLVLISLSELNILGPRDLVGKRVMIQRDVDDALIVATLNQMNIDESQINFVPHNFDNWALLKGEVDVMSAYITNQPYLYRQQGRSVNIINPVNYGIDFYGDNLFTSEEMINDKPEIVKAFQRASIKGWEYALSHSDEIIDLIYKKYQGQNPKDINGLRYEADMTRAMVKPNVVEIGSFNKARFNHIAEMYQERGRVPKDANLDGFFITDYFQQEDQSSVNFRRLSVITAISFLLALLLLAINYKLKAIIADKTRDLVVARDAAEASARSKSTFLASMSHEIRTPMNGIMGMLTLVSRSHLDSVQKHQLKLASNSARALLSLLDDILDFSKIEAGKLDLESVDFNVIELMSEIAQTHAFRIQKKRLEFVFDIHEVELEQVKGDSGRLRQIINNLLSNALKFTQSGSISLIVSTSKKAGGEVIVCCRVCDTGIGIEETKLNTIFENFTQVDASITRRYGGTGLGLAIIKQLCVAMNGQVSVTSELGQGSEFVVTLPLLESDLIPELDDHVTLANYVIGVIGDQQQSCQALANQLQRWGAQLEVLDSENAYTAIDRFFADHSHPVIIFITLECIINDQDRWSYWVEQSPKNIQWVLIMPINQGDEAQLLSSVKFTFTLLSPVVPQQLRAVLSELLNASSKDKSVAVIDVDSRLSSAQNLNIAEQCRVLLVEDNYINQVVACGILEDMHLRVDCVENGREAIDTMALMSSSDPYSLVLMDCQMPVMDGYQASRLIRAGEAGNAHVNVPIIAMTAHSMQGDKEKCLEAGMDDYLAKPLDAQLMEVKVIENLHRAIQQSLKDTEL